MFTGDHFADLVYAFLSITIASMLLERALSYLFDSLPQDIPLASDYLRVGAVRALVALFIALVICFYFEADLFRYIFPDASVYSVSLESVKAAAQAVMQAGTDEDVLEAGRTMHGALTPASALGVTITAFALAGGSAGMITLFQGLLGMSSEARAAVKAERQARAASVWVGVETEASKRRMSSDLPPVRDVTRGVGFGAGTQAPLKQRGESPPAKDESRSIGFSG